MKLKVVAQNHFKEPIGKYNETEAKKLVQFIKTKLKDKGYWGIYGRTAPHLELML